MNLDNCEKREKFWGELTVEEKMERMRDRVKRQERSIQELSMTVRILMNHSHKPDGDVVVPFSKGLIEGDPIDMDPNQRF